jgi:CP12 domain
LGTDIEECDVEAPSDDCLEYGSQLDELEALISEAASSVNAMESPMMDPRWENVSPLPMPKPGESRVVIETPILHQAVVAARAASATYGLTSPEATLAWEEVEEIYHSYEKQEALGGKINFDEECQTEMLEACEALEELHRALKLGE